MVEGKSQFVVEADGRRAIAKALQPRYLNRALMIICDGEMYRTIFCDACGGLRMIANEWPETVNAILLVNARCLQDSVEGTI